MGSVVWFDSWSDVARVLIVGSAGYVGLVLALRLSGKRTLSQLNAFDLIVTVALGSTFATTLLSSEVSWTEGIVALLLLVALQFIVAWASAEWGPFRRAVTSKPVFLVWEGEMLPQAVRRNRLTESQVHQAIRSSGHGDIRTIAAVVLEPNGTLSVISRDNLGNASALESIQRP